MRARLIPLALLIAAGVQQGAEAQVDNPLRRLLPSGSAYFLHACTNGAANAAEHGEIALNGEWIFATGHRSDELNQAGKMTGRSLFNNSVGSIDERWKPELIALYRQLAPKMTRDVGPHRAVGAKTDGIDIVRAGAPRRCSDGVVIGGRLRVLPPAPKGSAQAQATARLDEILGPQIKH